MFKGIFTGSVVLFILLIASSFSMAGELVIPASSGTAFTYVNQVIDNDAITVADPERVYVLERNGIYFLDATLTNTGYKLRIKAQDGDGQKPVIYGIANSTTAAFPSIFFEMGEDVSLKDLVIVGYIESQPGENVNNPTRFIRSRAAGFKLIIDGCILTQARGEHIRLEQAVLVTKITNCIFANMGDLQLSNLGAGKVIDYRNTSCDSAIFVNNTFINFHDRIIRHRASVAGINYLLYDHNTAINSLGYHGTIALGWMGEKGIITNNLFIDTFIAGADTDKVRQSEFEEQGEIDTRNGLGRMSWIMSVPNDTTDWKISGNYYSVSPEVQAFYNAHAAEGVLGEGPALTWHINSRLGADSVLAFIKESIEVAKRPVSMVNMAEWYRDPNGGNKTKNTPTPLFNPALHDFDRKPWQYFADTLDCSYAPTLAAYTGAAGGFPAGDLNWFPAKKTEWETYLTGITFKPGAVVTDFTLEQNYPNPFNPSTSITYDVAKTARISLVVYNSLGQMVAKLVDNKQQAAGKYEVSWTATDLSGKALSSGLYFYQLLVDNQSVMSKKMLLMK